MKKSMTNKNVLKNLQIKQNEEFNTKDYFFFCSVTDICDLFSIHKLYHSIMNITDLEKQAEQYLLFENVYANEGQKTALDKLKAFLENKEKRFFTLIGSAGTGKTTIMKKVKSFSTKSIYGSTISHQAKNVLSKSIESTCTIAGLLGIKLNEETGKFTQVEDLKNPPIIRRMRNSVLIVDETSMITKEIMDEIINKAPIDLKIIFVGDSKQLPPIGQKFGVSPTFSIAPEEDIAILTEVMRFGDNISLIANKIAKAIDNGGKLFMKRKDEFEKGEGVRFLKNEDVALSEAASDFLKDPFNTRLITYNNHLSPNEQSVRYLNTRLRELLYGYDSEQIVEGEIFTLYAPYNQTNEFGEEKTIAQNSDTFQVLKFEKKERNVYVHVYSHKLKDRSFESKYTVFDCEVKFQDGRLLRLDVNMDPEYKKDLKNIADSLDWQLYFGLQKQFALVEYGMAVTCHKCQGSGFDNVYVFEDNIMFSPQNTENKFRTFYTAATRAKKKLVIQGLRN